MHLVLAHVLQGDGALTCTGFDVIILPSLRSLSITGTLLAQDLDILSHLSFPATTTLQFYSETKTDTAITALSNLLTVHKASRNWELSPSTMFNVELGLCCNVLHITINPEGPRRGRKFLVEFHVVGEWRGTIDQIHDGPATAAIFSALPLDFIASFKTDCNISPSAWATIFGPLPNLKHITAAGSSAVNVLSAITDDFNARFPAALGSNSVSTTRKRKKAKGKGSGRRKIVPMEPMPSSQMIDWEPIFPVLEKITLFNTVFAASSANLLEALRERKGFGTVIKTISFNSDQNIDVGTKEALREVGTALWDGYGLLSSWLRDLYN
ncbi:hypothetical protein BDN72DRAFT_898554 [Pluteus cervinus]|uniref:Uncharacterized protein n=1 Tax=Pluteus cervinus TaxID=181527 RepID=A0ACD3AR27_9AGAR|nr:hypothetical protein BDN72DRAFT_898554 [Pluteus cervinus]